MSRAHKGFAEVFVCSNVVNVRQTQSPRGNHLNHHGTLPAPSGSEAVCIRRQRRLGAASKDGAEEALADLAKNVDNPEGAGFRNLCSSAAGPAEGNGVSAPHLCKYVGEKSVKVGGGVDVSKL